MLPDVDSQDFDAAFEQVFHEVEVDELRQRLQLLSEAVPAEQLLGAFARRLGDEEVNAVFQQRYETEKRLFLLKEKAASTGTFDVTQVAFGEIMSLKLKDRNMGRRKIDFRRISTEEPIFVAQSDYHDDSSSEEQQFRRKVKLIPDHTVLRIGSLMTDGDEKVLQSELNLATEISYQSLAEWAVPTTISDMRLYEVQLGGVNIMDRHFVYDFR